MKVFKKILLILATMALLALGFFFGKEYVSKNQDVENEEISEDSYEKIESLQASIKESYPEKSQRIDFPDNNNFFTIPGQEEIIQTDLGQYVDGELLVDVDLEEFDENIFEKYGANIIGKCDIWGGYQVSIPNKTIDELEAIAKEISQENGVLISEVHWIIPTQCNEYEYPDDNFILDYKNSIPPDDKKKPKDFNKDSLWGKFNPDKNWQKNLKAFEKIRYFLRADIELNNKNPYWGYKVTNLPYMRKNLESKSDVTVNVFENGIMENLNDDLDFENLNISDLNQDSDKDTSLKNPDLENDVKKEYEMADKINNEQGNKLTKHTYLVSSTIAAKHNNYGISGVSDKSKVQLMPYSSSLLPYLMAYRLYSPDNSSNIFNISWGYIIMSLYYINASDTNAAEIKNNEFREFLVNNRQFLKEEELKKQALKSDYQYFNEFINKEKSVDDNDKRRINLALRSFKNDNKDFLIVNSAGNEDEEIEKLKDFSDVKITKTTIFDDLDEDLKDHVIIVGAAYPKVSKDGISYWEYSTKKNVDIVAPGVAMPAYDEEGRVVLWQGTSAAAPFITGLAANLYSAYPDQMNGPLAKKLILESGNLDVIDSRNGENSKLVDARKLTELVKAEDFQEKDEDTKGLKEERIDAKSNKSKSSPDREKKSYYQDRNDPELAEDRRYFIENVLGKIDQVDFKESQIYLVKMKDDSSFYLVTKDNHSKYDLQNFKVYLAIPNADLSKYSLQSVEDFIPDEEFEGAFADLYIYNFYDPDKDKFTDYLFLFRDHGGNTVGDYTIRAIAMDKGNLYHIEELKDTLAYKDLVYTKDYPQGLLNGFKITLEPRNYHNVYIKHDFNNYDGNFTPIDLEINKEEKVQSKEDYDLGFVKLYRDIINSTKPYYNDEYHPLYLNESYYNEDLKFGLCKVDDFSYPNLILSSTHDGYSTYSVIQYIGNGKYNTHLILDPGQSGISSNYVYSYDDKHLFIDNTMNDEIYVIGKVDGKIRVNYGFSKNLQGPADVRIDLVGIDKTSAKAFDQESYNELVSRLKPVKMYPMNDKTYMEVIDKYKSGQSNGDVARESLYNLTINNPYTNKISYHELSVIEKDSLYYLDVNDYNKFSMEDSPYMTDPELKKYKDPYLKVLEENDGKYIKKNEDGTYYFCLYPGFLPTDDPNLIKYRFQYFPKYGATCFAYKDYMKVDEIIFLKSDYPGIITNDKLYLEADFLSWWMSFIYEINPTNKTINMTEEGHDIGEEGVDYITISTASYNSMEELLEDNFKK